MASIYRKSEIPDHLQRFFCPAEIGLEKTPEAFIAELVGVFREVKRVLRDDGVMWVNMGDSYSSGSRTTTTVQTLRGECGGEAIRATNCRPPVIDGIKPKDLIGIPWMLAFALRADGWYLRQDIIWHKPAPMPESVRDRCTKAHEYIFLLTKNARYYYDADAIAEESIWKPGESAEVERAPGYYSGKWSEVGQGLRNDSSFKAIRETRNARSVWTIGPSPFSEAHFATFPPALPERCIRAGTSEKGCCAVCGAPIVRVTEREARRRERPNELTKRTGENGTGNHCANTVAGVSVTTIGWQPSCDCNAATVPCRVLDPFFGAGTTGLVAQRMGRDCVGCELNDEYAEMARNRIYNDAPLLANVEAV